MSDIIKSARQQFFSTRVWQYGQRHEGNPNGFLNNQVDCTYFVYLSHLRAGYSVPYLASTQLVSNGQLTAEASKYYEVVDAANVRAGDVVYYPKGGVVPNNHTMLVTSSSVDSSGNVSGTAYGAQSSATGIKDNIAFGRSAQAGETPYYTVQPQLFLRVKESQYAAELDMTGSAGTGIGSPKVTSLVNLLKTEGVEGYRSGIYTDSKGIPTVGNGFALIAGGELRKEGEIKGLLRLAGLPESKYDELPLDKLQQAAELLQQGKVTDAKALFGDGKTPASGEFALTGAQADKLTAAFVVTDVIPKMISGLGVNRDPDNYNELTTGEFTALGTKIYQNPNWLNTAKGEQFFDAWFDDNKAAAISLLTEGQPALKSRLMSEAYEGSINTSNVNLTGAASAAAGSSTISQGNNDPLAIDPITQAALDSAFFGTVPGAPTDAVFVPIRATGTPVQPPSNPTADYVNSHIIPGRDGKTLLFPGGTSITLGAGEAYQLSDDLKTVYIARPTEGGAYLVTAYNTQLRSVGGSVVIGEGTPGRIVLKVNDPLAVNIDRVEGGVVVDAGNTIYTANSATGAAVLIVNSRDAQGNAISSVKIRSNANEALTEVPGAQGAAVLANGTVKIYTEQGVRTFDQGTLSAAEPVPTSNPQGADSLIEFINKDRSPEPTPTSPPNPPDATEELNGSLEPWLTDLADQLDAGNVSLYASNGAEDSGRVFGFEDDFVYRGKDANGFIHLETLGGDGQSGLPAGLAVYYDTETRQFILPAKDDIGPMLVNLNSGAAVALFNGQPKPQGWGFDSTTTNLLEDQSWDTISSGSIETVSTALAGSWVSFAVDEAADQLTGIASINGMSISATTNGIDPQDLAAWGFGFEGIDTSDSIVISIIKGLNPATLTANGQPTPQILQTPIRDANGQIIGYERALELANGTTLTTITNANGSPTQLLETRAQGNQVTTTTYALDSSGARTAQFLTQGIYSSNGAFSGQRTDLRTNTVYDIAIEPDGTETLTVNTSATEQVINQAGIAVLNDISSLIGAIQSGRPLPALSSGLVLANNLVNPTTGGTYIVNNAGLSTVTGVVGGLASLYNLSNALQNGDTLTQINASLSTLNYVNRTLPRLLDNAGPLNPALDGVLNGSGGGLINGGTPGVLPVLGLILSIRSGDPIGITSGIIGIVNPAVLASPVGWILAGFSILKALFDEPPEAWGVAKFVFDENGQLQIDVVGEAFGTDRVRSQLQQTQQVLQAMIAQAQIAAPDTALGIIPQRTASITWREVRQSDKGYAINDIDPITGAQRYPFLRWDDNGVPFSSNPAVWQPDTTDPNIRVAMTEQLIASALRREAIAPTWEVNTAKMQQDSGDSLAGLTEAERAARVGLGASYDAATGKPIGQFRAVTLDLDGDGTITVAAKDEATNTIGFDWDDSGFNKQVSWVKPNDGFLFLDRDSNGVVSSGRELFSNSRVSDDYKGVRSIEWVDANRDGKINSLDPVYRELKVWQDANQDGDSFTVLPNGAVVVDTHELKTLSELGIAELDYINARFVRNGNLFALRSDALQADAEGARVTQVGNGITIDYSNGTSQFIITQVTSLAGGNDRIDGLYEDGDPFGYPRATPMEIIIPVSLLLANDGAATHPTNYYEFNSTLRRFYAGEVPKTLIKQAQNDVAWRVIA